MKHHHLFLVACLLWLAFDSAQAQTKLKLANIIPGTENVQLVQNGDFQFQGPVTATNSPGLISKEIPRSAGQPECPPSYILDRSAQTMLI